mgnify:CR=1 FL=1
MFIESFSIHDARDESTAAPGGPQRVVDDRCDRIETADSEVQAFLDEPDRRARLTREATILAEQYPSWNPPPLFGVPVGVKDIFHVDGRPTRAGSDLPPSALAGPEAAVVSALKAAGALVMGKTVTTEFAYYAPGPTRNPHNLEHTPGGSSSGSAAAVAAGMVPLALGSQTIGSTIRPAAFCGIVGFKPTFDRIPTDGVIPLSPSVDHVGLFTQTVRGMRTAAGVVCGDWDGHHRPDGKPTLGIPAGPYLDQTSEEGRERLRDHLAHLEERGYTVKRVETLENIESVNDRHNRLVAAEAAIAHHDWFEAYGDRYREGTIELLEEGGDVDIDELASARAGRGTLRAQVQQTMRDENIDLWVTPAAPGPAPSGIDSTGDPVMNLPWTHSGLPALALPAGRASNDLPVGVQCVAPAGADETLLGWGSELETALAED